MEKYSKHELANIISYKKQSSVLKAPAKCYHSDIVKSFKHGMPHKYVCTDCGMRSFERSAFFDYSHSHRLIH